MEAVSAGVDFLVEVEDLAAVVVDSQEAADRSAAAAQAEAGKLIGNGRHNTQAQCLS